ncbi:hypothetical protein AQUCO_00700665v1 [Aquilegia coerulea]|uniref:BHLH domain-containing protein n=1 Tax=Aquilegia coerulea TaxID=218851 RepID=A0A2G5EL46_AQUCA|nr:hypothetical protein AQUCO_00700665v1 [Aquilegia coerulea]
MEVDLLKCATEEQMEMMMMMMQMDKLPEFNGSFPDISELPLIDFSGGTSNSCTGITSPMFANTTNASSSSSSSFSFMNSNLQDPSAPPILPNGMSGKFKNGADLLGTNNFSCPSQKRNSMAAMREMIFRIAAMQPIHIDPESVKPPKRRNVKISKDPQSVAARHRRERISERIRILQRLVPGGTKMDTASMLDEAIHYVKFLKTQVQSLERAATNRPTTSLGYPAGVSNPNYSSFGKAYQPPQMFSSTPMLR